MKRFIAIIATFCMLTSTVVFANSDYCDFTEDRVHDFEYATGMEVRHPHKGFLECGCGKKVYFDKLYSSECERCRKELCQKGIHYYLNDTIYTNDNYGYGTCYCGKKKTFSSYTNDLFEVEDGYIYRFGEYIELNHPHWPMELDEEELEELECNESWCYIGSCGVCKLGSEYERQVGEYNLNHFYYQNDYHDYDYESEEDCDDDYECDFEEEETYEYVAEPKEEYSDESLQLEEWLKIAKEILSD